MKRIFTLLLCVACLCGCHCQKNVPEKTAPTASKVVAPHVLIYKTKGDFSRNVPITLSEDGEAIVSYPHPRDLYVNGELAVPTALAKGYWLDRRGINPQVAFLSYTYEEYAKLSSPPSMEDLKKHIVEAHPLKEMWDCGPRRNFAELVPELNALIKHKELKTKCNRIK